MGAAALGALTAASLKKIGHLTLCVLISFAAGALLAVSLFDILPEVFESAGVARGLFSFASGYVLFWLLTRFVYHVCPACSATHTEVEFKALTAAMIAALSIHSFMDGLAIAGAAGSSTGLLILLAVAYHKFPEGLALALIARESGMGRGRAFAISVALEASTTVLGGLAGFFLPIAEGPWAGYVLAHAAGGFVFIVLHALWSEAVKHHPRYTLLSAALGALSIWAVQYFFL